MGAKKRQYYTAQYNTPEAERARKLARVQQTTLQKRRAKALKEQAHLSVNDIKVSGVDASADGAAPAGKAGRPERAPAAPPVGRRQGEAPPKKDAAPAAEIEAAKAARKRQRAALTQLHRRHTKKGQLKLGEIGEALFLKLQNGE